MGIDALSLIKNKKVLVGLFIFSIGAFLFLFSPTPVDARGLIPGCSFFGDVDNDGDIDFDDASNAVTLIGPVDSSLASMVADVSDDGLITFVGDVLTIIAYAGGSIDTFPVCNDLRSRPEMPCAPTGNIDLQSKPGVSVFDALLIARKILGLGTLDFFQKEKGDVWLHSHPVGSNTITIVDAQIMAQYYGGFIDDFGPCPPINVKSSPITSVAMSGSQGGTSGITNYTINPTPSTGRINTDITAPLTVGGYNFSSWTGNCTSVSGNVCRVTSPLDILDSSKTIKANYVLDPGDIVLNPPTTGCPGPIVKLSWSSTTTDSTYNIIMDGIAVSSSSGLSWTSGTLTAGVSHSWKIQGTSSGVVSNGRVYTTLTCPPLGSTLPCPATGPGLGDVNFDGFISIVDSTWIVEHVVGLRSFSATQLIRADVDGDGLITVLDAFEILVYIGGGPNFTGCLPPAAPDLVPDSLSTNIPGTIETDNLVWFNGIVRNDGTASVGSPSIARFRVDIGSNGSWDGGVGTNPVPDLPPTDSSPVSSSASLQRTYPAGTHKVELCADYPNTVVESNEGNNCMTIPFTVAVAVPDPWIQTKVGNVGARGGINVETGPPTGEYNADYLVIADSIAGNRFTSAKEWLVKNYTFNPSSLEASSDIYDALWNKYKNRGTTTVDLSQSNNVVSKIRAAAGPNGGILTYTPASGNAKFRDPSNYTGRPAVVFIDGDLTIEERVKIKEDTGLVFIVNGDILIKGSVKKIDGFYIAKGTIDTAVGAAPVGPQTVSISASYDGYWHSAAGCIDNTGLVPVGLGSGGQLVRIYVSFPLSDLPSDATVTDVKLKVKVSSIWGGGVTANVQAYNQDGQANPATDSCTDRKTRTANANAANPSYLSNITTLQSLGIKDLQLPPVANAEVESARSAAGNRFSIGFNENGTPISNHSWLVGGMGVGGMKLVITYTVPSAQLAINGSALAFSGFNLGRELGADCSGMCDENDPAERFFYQPRYLWLFREILGEINQTFQELAP